MTAPIEITKVCIWCSQPVVITFTSPEDIRGYLEWKSGEYIQDAFPHWTAGQREELISGTHNKCFDEMFAEPDEAEEDANA